MATKKREGVKQFGKIEQLKGVNMDNITCAEIIADLISRGNLSDIEIEALCKARYETMCKHSPIQAHKCQAPIMFLPLSEMKTIYVDSCIQAEIIDLIRNHNIRTVGCCCGHGIKQAYIQVTDISAPRMIDLGYEQLPLDKHGNCKNCFKPKTILPNYLDEACDIYASDLNEAGAEKCSCFKKRNRFVEIEGINENIKYIRENLSDKARLIQLGEECAELSAAIFKLLRKTETDNPTPKSLDEVRKNLIEEIEDVTVSISVISEHLIDRKIFESKLKRWVERLKEREKNGKN